MMHETTIGYHLKQAQHALRLASDAALREIDLTLPQYAALTAIAGNPGISSAEVARQAFVTPQTMSEIVALLVRAGLIERHPHPIHGRIVQLLLAPLGKEVLGKAQRAIAQIEARMVSGLTEAEQERFANYLRSCSEALS